MEFELKHVSILDWARLAIGAENDNLSLPKEKVYFTPRTVAHVRVIFSIFRSATPSARSMDIKLWVKSDYNIRVDFKVVDKETSRSVSFTNVLFSRTSTHYLHWGDLSNLYATEHLNLEWTVILKPKILVISNRQRFAVKYGDEFSDFKVICKDQEFNVHRSMLALASNWFCQNIESLGKVIEFEDFEPSIVQAAFNLIYTRKLDDDLDIKMLLELLTFANQYELKDKDLIIKKIEDNLTLENACYLTVYDDYDSDDSAEWISVSAEYRLAGQINKVAGLDGNEFLDSEQIHNLLYNANEIRLYREKVKKCTEKNLGFVPLD